MSTVPLRALALLALLAACEAPPPGEAPAAKSEALGCGPSDETLRVMTGLAPTCAGCHATGARGYFASPAAFQSLLVADPSLVVPGSPDESELVKLLEGTSRRTFPQMPPAGSPWAALPAETPGAIGMAEIRDWIRGLAAQHREASPDPQAPRVTRLSAAQIQRSLYQQLGLAHDDFFREATDFGIARAEARTDDLYPLQSADALPAPRQQTTEERFEALGGGSVFQQIRPSRDPSPAFGLMLTQVSQRWCRLALAKAGNTALFPAGSARTANEPDVRATIARWSLHFLAEPAAPADVDRLYAKLFLPLVAGTDTEPAYVGLCSWFVRHPHWVVY